MKNRLLTLLSLFCMALVANAQYRDWEAPSPTRAPFVDVVENGKTYLIYNVETETFMCNGLDWDTRTCVSPQYANQYLLETKQVLNRATGQPRQGTGGWTIKTMSCTNNITKVLNKYVFIDGPAASYQDMASQGHNYFDIVPLGNGTYQIRAIASDDKYGKGVEGWDYDVYSFGVLLPEEGAEPATYTAVNPNGVAATHGVTWKFADATLYNTLIELYDLLEKNYAAQAAEKVEDVSAFVAVYNDEAATVEEIQAAIDGLTQAIHDKPFESLMVATEDDPIDITSMMQNADFNAGNANGWTNTFVGGKNANNVGYQSARYTNGDVKIEKFIEAWANKDFTGVGYRSLGDGELSQTLKSMPAGKYMLTVDCISNQQDGRSNPAVGVELFCSSGEFESSQNLSTGNGKPEHFEIDFFSVGGDLTVGLRTRNATANWIAADNFRLYFKGAIGPDENPAKIALNSVIKSYSKWDPEENGNFWNLKANAGIREAWMAALSAAKEAYSDFKKAEADLQAAAAVFETTLADYKELEAAIANCEAKIKEVEETFPEAASALHAQLNIWADAYEKETYTSVDVVGLNEKIMEIVTENVAIRMQAGDEVTCLLNNPGFDTDFSGWNVSGTSPVWGGMDKENTNGSGKLLSEINSGNAEVYHAAFSISQTLKNMPAGIFTLSCQAFERDDNYAGINAELFAVVNGKEQVVKIKNLYGDGSDEVLYQNGTSTWDTSLPNSWEGKYVPNTMCGANVYFAEGYYKNKFCFILDEPVDVTVGIRTTSAGDWVLFDDFKIVFEGDAVEPLQEVLQSLCDVVSAAKTDAEDYESCTSPALADITAAYAKAEPTLSSTSREELRTAYVELSDAYKAFQANVSSLRNLFAAFNRMENASDAFMYYVKDPAVIAEQEELENICADDLFFDYTTAELDTCAKQIDAQIDKIQAWKSFQEFIAEEGDEYADDLGQGEFFTKGELYIKAVEDEVLRSEYAAVKAALNAGNYPVNTAELPAYRKSLEDLLGRMEVWYNYGEAKKRILPEGWESASDDNLIEFTEAVMVNANLNKGADQGWQWTGEAMYGPVKGNGPIDGSSCMESWNPTAAGNDFDFYQKIFCLPEGRYMLWVTAIISKNNEEGLGEGNQSVGGGVQDYGAKLYAHIQNGETDEWHVAPILKVVEEAPTEEMAATGAHDYCVYFEVPAAADNAPRGVEVTVGVKSSDNMPGRWFVADDFQLIYYGKGMTDIPLDLNSDGHIAVGDVVKTIATRRFTVVSRVVEAVLDSKEGEAGGHRYVDLGLPSGTLWATCDLGANTPLQEGAWFTWGTTVANDETCDAETLSLSALKRWGVVDGQGNLTQENDAASVLWGEAWSMPTKDDVQELIDFCTWKRTTFLGKTLFKVTGPQGNSIYLDGEQTYWTASWASDSDMSSYSFCGNTPSQATRTTQCGIRPVVRKR